MGALIASTSIFVVILVGAIVLLLHFLPAFIAGNRHATHFWWIFLINLFFGWTLIGWIVALVWALRDEPRYIFR